MNDITPRIEAELVAIEQTEDVQVFYCCESGSRAWGFPSQNSDYDARFLYVRRPEWYFSINVEHKRDVIERPIADELDVNGWDLRKALALLRKSNPPLLEWLQSPIIYRDRLGIAEKLRDVVAEYYSPAASLYHYLHMARGNYRDYLHGETVWVKKYFYVLRPLLAVRWIEQDRGVVPTEFGALVEAIVTDPALKTAIDGLLERKMAGDELDEGPRIPAIGDFIDAEIARLEDFSVPPGHQPADVEWLNQIFRSAVAESWDAYE